MKSELFKYEDVRIEIAPDKKSIVVINRQDVKTNPIPVHDTPENFAKWLAGKLTDKTSFKTPMITDTEGFIKAFTSKLKGEPVKTEPKIVFETPTTQPKTTPTLPTISVDEGVKPVMPTEEPTSDITEYFEEKEEVPVTPVPAIPIEVAEETKPTESPVTAPTVEEAIPKPAEKPTDSMAIVSRYQELRKQYSGLINTLGEEQANNIILQQMSKELGIDLSEITKILPTTTEKPKPTEVPVVAETKPTPVVPTEEIPTKPSALPEDVREELTNLPKPQRLMLKRIAEHFNIDLESLVLKCVREAKKSVIPTHWLQRAYLMGRQVGIVSAAGESVLHAVFSTSDETFDVIVNKKNDNQLAINKFYKIDIPDLGTKVVRCIARSMYPQSREYFTDLKFIEEVQPVDVEIPSIPTASAILASGLMKLNDVYNALKQTDGNAGMVAVSGLVEDVREPRENLFYLTINDGTSPRARMFSVQLLAKNPFGITRKEIENSEGKTVFVYGWAQLTPPSEKFSKDSVSIVPMYLAIE